MRMFWYVALAASALSAPVLANDAPSEPRRTLVLYQELMRRVADSLCTFLPTSPSVTVSYTLLPPVRYWYLEQPVIDAIRVRSGSVKNSPDADYVADFGITRTFVSYINPRRSWFLGSQSVDRVLQLVVWTKLVEQRSGTVLTAGESVVVFSDTVDVSDIESLETPGVPETRGALPSPGIVSSLVEPVVLIGSLAIAIFLLFSVRS